MSHAYLWWQHEGNRALRVDDWKIVAAGEGAAWELYDLKRDRAESNNMSAKQPGKVRELERIWIKHLEETRALAIKD